MTFNPNHSKLGADEGKLTPLFASEEKHYLVPFQDLVFPTEQFRKRTFVPERDCEQTKSPKLEANTGLVSSAQAHVMCT